MDIPFSDEKVNWPGFFNWVKYSPTSLSKVCEKHVPKAGSGEQVWVNGLQANAHEAKVKKGIALNIIDLATKMNEWKIQKNTQVQRWVSKWARYKVTRYV